MHEKQQIGQTLRTLLSGYASQSSRGEFEVEKDIAEIRKSTALIETLFPDWVILLCLVQHPSVPYISPNSTIVLGYPPEQLMGITPEGFYGLIHPEDLSAVKRAYHFMKDFVVGHDGYEPEQYRFAFQYRMRQPNGQFRLLLDEKLAVRNQHNRYVFFTLFKDLSQERKFTRVQLEVFRYQDNTLEKISEYIPYTGDSVITPREKEIIRLIEGGFNNQEISRQLSISIHTVKNHRRNLFRKAKVRNSLGLLLVARQAKWI